MKAERHAPLKFLHLEISAFYAKDGRYYGSVRPQVLRSVINRSIDISLLHMMIHVTIAILEIELILKRGEKDKIDNHSANKINC
jgi:hypothetical protein